MDKFLTYKNFLNSKIRKKKNKTAVITGGCGRIGSIFTSQLLYDNFEIHHIPWISLYLNIVLRLAKWLRSTRDYLFKKL